MTLALSGKGSTFPACGELRTPPLCKGLWPWAAVRARDLAASTRSPSPNTTRRQVSQHANCQGLRLRSEPPASLGRGALRYLSAVQVPSRLGLVAIPVHATSSMGMRYNNAAQSDAFRSALNAPTPSAPGRER